MKIAIPTGERGKSLALEEEESLAVHYFDRIAGEERELVIPISLIEKLWPRKSAPAGDEPRRDFQRSIN
jgi:hypothetical protein